MKLVVDVQQRYAKMRAHTATHLLHAVLDEMLWGTKQAWSLVEQDYLRFDFAAKQPLTNDQLAQIDSKINHWIAHSLQVTTTECAYAEAIKLGAKAFFEDKYGDVVRVVSMQDGDVSLTSIELCGGTHVTNTNHIGAFKIVEQEAVASGVRRIIAVTWPKVAIQAHTLEKELHALAEKLDCQPKQLTEKLDKVLKTYTEQQATIEQLTTQLVGTALAKLSAHKIADDVLAYDCTPLATFAFKDIVTQAKTLRPTSNLCLYAASGSFALLFPGGWAKAFADALHLKGGGSDTLVQGKDGEIKEKVGK